MRILIPAFILCALVTSGCATPVPPAIRSPAAGDLRLAEAHQAIDSHRGRRVRWGGTIAGVENRKTTTVLEVVGRTLDGNGRPRATDHSEGRFLAEVEGFLDPALYSAGREITVSGTLSGGVTRAIGEYPYTYPIVRVEVFHLWEPRPERLPDYYYDPFWPYHWGPWWYPYPRHYW